jgi:hypothetical protein
VAFRNVLRMSSPNAPCDDASMLIVTVADPRGRCAVVVDCCSQLV